MSARTLAELRDRGLLFQPHEAVAIAQQVIQPFCLPGSAAAAAAGPPSPENVFLFPDGSVECGCHATPAVSEMAILLQSLLPAGAAPAPGGLRYAIARGLLDVEAPPFDSLDEFSKTLARFERGDRREIVRGLLARADAVASGADDDRTMTDLARLASRAGGGPVAGDRRRCSLTTSDLRRALRDADRLRFEERAGVSCTCAADAARRRPRWMPAAAVLAAAMVGGGAVELAHRQGLMARRSEPAPVVAQVDAAPGVAAAPVLAVSGVASGRLPSAEPQPTTAVRAVKPKPAATRVARHPVQRHPVRGELRTDAPSQPSAKQPIESASETRPHKSEPSALGQFFRFKWLRNAFAQKD